MPSADRTRPALSARRAVGVFNYFTANPRGAFTLSELAADLEVSPASMLAVLKALTESGYLVRDPRRKTYELGPAMIAAGHAASLRHPVVEIARAEIERLAAEWGECVGSVVVGRDILILIVEGRPVARSHDVWRGQRLPLIPPLGQVFVAWSPDDVVEEWLARGELGQPAADRMLVGLERVRERGYAIGLRDEVSQQMDEVIGLLARRPLDDVLRDQLTAVMSQDRNDYAVVDAEPEGRYTVSSLAAPVFDPDGRVVFAVTMDGLAGELTGREIARAATELTNATRAISRELGGRVPVLGRHERTP